MYILPNWENGQRKIPSPIKPREMKKPAIGQQIHIDIIFVKSAKGLRYYLLGVEGVTKYAHLLKMNGKSKEDILGPIKIIAGMFKQVRVTLHSDRESGLIALQNDLLKDGISLVNTGAGDHERIAENFVGTLRKKFRAILHSLEYELPLELYPDLLEHLVFVNNLTANKKVGENLPYELITGKQYDARLAQHEFGETGLFYNPNNKDKYLGGEIGIVIGLAYESSSIKGYKILEKTRVERSKFVPVPVERLPIEARKMINCKIDRVTRIKIDRPIEEVCGAVELSFPVEVHETSTTVREGYSSKMEDGTEIEAFSHANPLSNMEDLPVVTELLPMSGLLAIDELAPHRGIQTREVSGSVEEAKRGNDYRSSKTNSVFHGKRGADNDSNSSYQ